LIDKTGKELTPLMYDDLTFNIGLEAYKIARVFVGERMYNDPHEGKYGLIDNTGKELTPLMYDKMRTFNEGLIPVKLEDKWGFVDETGKVVLPLIYDDVIERQVVVDNRYVNLFGFHENEAMVKLNGNEILIDKKGNKLRDVRWAGREDANKIQKIKNAIEGTTAEAIISTNGNALVIIDGNGVKYPIKEFNENYRLVYAHLNSKKDKIVVTDVNGNVSVVNFVGEEDLVYVNSSSSSAQNAKSAIWIDSNVRITYQDGHATIFFRDVSRWRQL